MFLPMISQWNIPRLRAEVRPGFSRNPQRNEPYCQVVDAYHQLQYPFRPKDLARDTWIARHREADDLAFVIRHHVNDFGCVWMPLEKRQAFYLIRQCITHITEIGPLEDALPHPDDVELWSKRSHDGQGA